MSASGKGESRPSVNVAAPAPSFGVQFPLSDQGDRQTVCDRNYENRQEIVVHQHNAATVFKGKDTIFELTHLLETASCRPYCLNDWQV